MPLSMKSLAGIISFTLLITNSVYAGSFSLYTESTGSAVGNYAAGIAAEAADASTGWYNPAGLVLLHEQQLVLGGVGVFPVAELTGISTFSTPATGAPNYIQTYSNVSGGESAFVPSLHYVLPLGENAAFGLSIVAPFGLMTDWSNSSPVRYEATTSKLITTDISPELGGRFNENFSIGAGLDLQFASVKFNSVLGSPVLLNEFATVVPGISATSLDSISYNKGESFGLGFHAGIMGLFNQEHTRIGLNYQSRVTHRFTGYSRLTGPLATPGLIPDPLGVLTAESNATFLSNDLNSNYIALPDILTISAYQDVNPRLALLGSLVYTGWHSFKTIELGNVAAYVFPAGQTVVDFVSPEHYQDVWRAAIGANYHWNEQWMLRVGGGYDETPTVNNYRDVRVPDSDRWALSVGTRYQWLPNFSVDLGYTHLFAVGNSQINRTDIVGLDPISTYTVNADINSYANLVGIQLNWVLDPVTVVTTK